MTSCIVPAQPHDALEQRQPRGARRRRDAERHARAEEAGRCERGALAAHIGAGQHRDARQVQRERGVAPAARGQLLGERREDARIERDRRRKFRKAPSPSLGERGACQHVVQCAEGARRGDDVIVFGCDAYRKLAAGCFFRRGETREGVVARPGLQVKGNDAVGRRCAHQAQLGRQRIRMQLAHDDELVARRNDAQRFAHALGDGAPLKVELVLGPQQLRASGTEPDTERIA